MKEAAVSTNNPKPVGEKASPTIDNDEAAECRVCNTKGAKVTLIIGANTPDSSYHMKPPAMKSVAVKTEEASVQRIRTTLRRNWLLSKK